MRISYPHLQTEPAKVPKTLVFSKTPKPGPTACTLPRTVPFKGSFFDVNQSPQQITVANLIARLQKEDQNKPVVFGCVELRYMRVTDRGDFVQIEFRQNVSVNSDGQILVEPRGD